jgi:hypothetical protein
VPARFCTQDPAVAPPSLPACAAAIAFWSIALRVCGFGRALRLLNHLTKRKPLHTQANPARVVEVGQRVSAVAALSPFRALCLEQSFALCYLLRRRSVAARLRLGVQAYPFAAHAWVEYEGLPLNELGEVLEAIVPLQDAL